MQQTELLRLFWISYDVFCISKKLSFLNWRGPIKHINVKQTFKSVKFECFTTTVYPHATKIHCKAKYCPWKTFLLQERNEFQWSIASVKVWTSKAQQTIILNIQLESSITNVVVLLRKHRTLHVTLQLHKDVFVPVIPDITLYI